MCTAHMGVRASQCGAIFARMSSSQPASSASWNRCPWSGHLQHRPSCPAPPAPPGRRRRIRGQVAADHARAAERGRGLHVPVVEPVLIGVRPLRAPPLQRDAGDGPQVIQRRPGLAAWTRMLIVSARSSAGSFLVHSAIAIAQDLEMSASARAPVMSGWLRSSRLRRTLARASPGSCPSSPSATQPSCRTRRCRERRPRRPRQHRGVRGGERRLDLAQRPQHRPASGGIQLLGTRAVRGSPVRRASSAAPPRHCRTHGRLRCNPEPPRVMP